MQITLQEKTMHPLNATIDKSLYQQAKLHSFISNKSISQIIREELNFYLKKETNGKVKAQLVPEQEILGILVKDRCIAEDEFVKEFNLCKKFVKKNC